MSSRESCPLQTWRGNQTVQEFLVLSKTARFLLKNKTKQNTPCALRSSSKAATFRMFRSRILTAGEERKGEYGLHCRGRKSVHRPHESVLTHREYSGCEREQKKKSNRDGAGVGTPLSPGFEPLLLGWRRADLCWRSTAACPSPQRAS